MKTTFSVVAAATFAALWMSPASANHAHTNCGPDQTTADKERCPTVHKKHRRHVAPVSSSLLSNDQPGAIDDNSSTEISRDREPMVSHFR